MAKTSAMPLYTAEDGTTLTYRRLGMGEPLVCLPGGALRDPDYLGDLAGLASDHRELIIPELRKTRVDWLVADVEALRLELGLEQIEVLAHSAGANLALLYAAAHPKRISRLVLVTPGTRAVGLEVEDEDWDAILARRSAEPWFESATDALEALFEGKDSPENRLASAALWYGNWSAAAQEHAASDERQRTPHARTIYYKPGALNPPATVAALADFLAPTLILAGDLDLMVTPTCAAELCALLPGASVEVLPGCGHFPWVEYPEQFLKAVTAFLP